MGHDPEYSDPFTLADRLEAAMERAAVTRRGLAVKLAGGTGDKAQIERWRKQIRRMLAGHQKTVHQTTAARLSEVLGVPERYWPTERSPQPDHPVTVAAELLRRLEDGEPVPPEILLHAAQAVEETAALAAQFAARLRQAAEDRRSAP